MDTRHLKYRNIAFFLSIIFLILFSSLFIVIDRGYFDAIDSAINIEMADLQNPLIHSFFKILEYIFDPITMIFFSLLVSCVLWFRNKRKPAVFFALTTIATGTLILTLKELFKITRPSNIIETGFTYTGFSFPSGHAVFAVVLFGLLILFSHHKFKKNINIFISILSVIAMGIIAFSRIYLHAHWFSDVLGGFLLGLFVLSTSLMIKLRYFKR